MRSGPIWGRSGAIWGRSGGDLGRSGGYLGTLWGVLVRYGGGLDGEEAQTPINRARAQVNSRVFMGGMA